MPPHPDNAAVVRDFYQHQLLAGDPGVVARYFTEGFVDHDPPHPSFPGGHDGVRAVMRVLSSAFSDRTLEVHDVFGSGDRVAIRFTIRGTHTGPFQGSPPTGGRVTLDIIALVRMEGGKIAERWGKVAVSGLGRPG